jgi:hypothetical protein
MGSTSASILRERGILVLRCPLVVFARYLPLVTTQRTYARPQNSPANVVSPTLLQFVLLSMLLHLLLVVLFGNSPSGSARRGDGWLGPLDVTLRQLSPERGSGFTWAPGADTNLPGTALLRRLDGSTTAPAAAQPQENAAARVAPQEPARTAPSEPVPLPVPVPASTDTSESVPEVSLSRRPLPAESLPRLDRNAPEEVDKPLMPPAVSTPPISPPRAEKEIVPPVVSPQREVAMPPMAPIAPIERVAPRTIERQFAPPVELRPREVPIAPPTPPLELKAREEPSPVVPPAVLPAAPAAPVKIEQEQAPAVEVKPRDIPMQPLAPVERFAPPKMERSFVPPVETAAPARVAPTPARVLQPESQPVSPPTTQPMPSKESVEIAPARERAVPAVTPGKSQQVTAPARVESPTGGELPRLRLGAPDVDEEVFRSRRDGVVPTPEPTGTPGVTAESLRKSATRVISREGSGSSGVLNFVPPPPQERKDSLAEGIAKAAKPDCRTAYAGMGLLAVVPLVASTVGNGGCRW